MLRVAARDLAGSPLDEIVAEISAVAEACVAEAAGRAARGGLAVLALGKLGGAELNYASDVDVVFVHDEGGPDRQDEAERQASALMQTLSEQTSEGIALRVDAALRPGGRAGPLSRSLAAMGAYYAEQAATWERQALIKARPVAGDARLGAEFVTAVAPFVYPEELATAGDRRGPSGQGPDRGVRPCPRQGRGRGQARMGRDPRRRVRRAAAADRPRSPRRAPARAEHPPRTRGARRRGLRDRGGRGRARWRVPVPADARASPPDGPRPADARAARRPRGADGPGSLARARRRGRAAGRVRTADRARAGPARAPVLPSAPRGLRRDERRRGRAPIARRPRSCSPVSASPGPAPPTRSSRASSTPPRASARCSPTSSR